MTKQIDSSNLSTLLTGIKNYVDNKFATKAKVAEYLPKSGGELTGVITATNTNGAAPFVIDTTDNGENADKAWISANNGNGAFFETEEDGTIGSRLVLRYPSHATQSGHFQLRAMNGTASSTLIGTPEGSLTWKGNELATDNNVVHLAGAEVITGAKSFVEDVNRKYKTVSKGDVPESTQYISYRFIDKNANSLAGLQHRVFPSGGAQVRMFVYKNEASSSDNAELGINYSASGTAHGYAPTTPSGSASNEIVTANYLNSTNSGVVHTTGNETVAGTKTFSVSPVVPTATTGDSSTKAASTAFVADAISTADANVVHTTGNETVAGTKSFTGAINIADGAGITFTNNGVTQRLISTTPNLQSVSGNNAVSLRLGYGGSTYVTGGECSSYITTDNGFSYTNENVQLMADSNIYLRTGLNSGWNADLGAVATSTNFRPIASLGMTLGSASYYWGDTYLQSIFSKGTRISFDATSGATSAIHRSANTGTLAIYGGTWNQKDGGVLYLQGAGSSTNPGTFSLTTTDGTNVKEFKGSYSDGLTWGGKALAIDEDVVHLAGNETITGFKNFQANPSIQKTAATKGTAPSAVQYWTIGFVDKNGTATANRLGAVETSLDKSNNVVSFLRAYKPTSASTVTANLSVTYPASGDPYASAPSTPSGSTGTEIATADFVTGLDSNVVHLTGAETVTGVKTHKSEINIQFTNITKGTIPTANHYMSYKWLDNAGTVMGGVQNYVYKTSGNTMTRMYAYHNDADTNKFASIGVVYPTTGDPYGSAPSTPAGSDGTQIVTADFMKDWVKTTVPTGAKFTDTVTTATTSGSGNVVTAVSASNGALTVTKGSTAVLTSGNQTIAGTKTFSDPPIIDRSDVTTTTGTLIGAYTFKASTPSGTAVNLIPFQYIPSDQTANIGIAIGSQSGATVIGAGEGGKKIYATNNAVANSESLYLAADGNIVAYCGCANDGSGATNVFTTSETSSTFYVPLYAPTATSGTNNTQVATTAFVNSAIASDSSVVHTTGDETVGGKKTFTSIPLVTGASPCYQLKNTGVTKGTAPSANNNKYIMQLFDSNGTGYLSALYKTISTGNVTSTRLYDYGNSASGTTNLGAYIAVCHDGSGNAYTYAPTPAAGDNSTKIATTAWVTTELGDYATQSWVEGKGYSTTDTKNTAGSTASTAKMFLIGAASQAANPQTYSNASVYATNGAFVAKTVQASSDRRLKDDIEPVAPDLSSLGTYRYVFKADEDRAKHVGLIAQEVETVLPEAVLTDPETGYKALDYNAIVAALVAEVNALKLRVAELERNNGKEG